MNFLNWYRYRELNFYRKVFDGFVKFDRYRERIVIENIAIERGLAMEMYGSKIGTEGFRSL